MVQTRLREGLSLSLSPYLSLYLYIYLYLNNQRNQCEKSGLKKPIILQPDLKINNYMLS